MTCVAVLMTAFVLMLTSSSVIDGKYVEGVVDTSKVSAAAISERARPFPACPACRVSWLSARVSFSLRTLTAFDSFYEVP